MILVTSKEFDTELTKLLKRNPLIQKRIVKTLHILQYKPDHPSLRLHKLVGSNYYSISVTMSLRIICHFGSTYITLLKIGKHEDVY